MTQEELLILLNKYLGGKANPEEQQQLEQWYQDGLDKDLLVEIGAVTADETEISLHHAMLEKVHQSIAARSPRKTNIYLSWFKYSAAAVLLIIAGVYFNQRVQTKQVSPLTTVNDIVAPMTSRASLTLDDGTIITVDQMASGEIAVQNTTSILKTDGGEIVYNTKVSEGPELFNTLSNPRGSRALSMKLSDGTKVWLNAGSTLKYPVYFNGKQRVVEINGEGYFEVAPDKLHPFHVRKTNADANIVVLGTSFNVNAYDDESELKVNLIEGKVKVERLKKAVMLLPGREATLSKNGDVTAHANPNMESVLAWKNGEFILKGISLKQLMRQISRWYDVEVDIQGNLDEVSFYGVVDRKENLSEVLKIMEKTGEISFNIQGKKIIVNMAK